MQHIDRPAHIQAFPEPLGEARPRMELEPPRDVLCPDCSGRIGGYRRRYRYIRQRPAIRPPELEGPVDPALELVALLVHCAVMAATEERQIR
jgi:hypothetical protein